MGVVFNSSDSSLNLHAATTPDDWVSVLKIEHCNRAARRIIIRELLGGVQNVGVALGYYQYV